mgnify:CR=1 FL=1
MDHGVHDLHDRVAAEGRSARSHLVQEAPEREDVTALVDGAPQRLLALVNAPAVGGQGRLTREALDECDSQTFSLMHRCGLALQPQAHEVVRTTPDDFHRLFPGTGGALYGQATHGWMSAFARSNSASRIPGLFLAGGSVHPGPGVPMAALSGQLAAEAVMAHRALTKRFHPVPTSGGMSTP